MRLAHYTDDRIKDEFADGHRIEWQRFHDARNSIIVACAKFGTIGPYGVFETESSEPDPSFATAELGSSEPDFWIESDQYNHERYIYMQIFRADVIHAEWLSSLCTSLLSLQGWAIGVSNIRDGYAVILPEMMLVNGRAFQTCASIKDALQAVRRGIVARA
jgi:hypothetical protein